MKKLLADVQIGREWFLGEGKPIADAQQFQSPGNLISIILKNAYIAAGIVFFILLLFGGLSIILGAGGGDPKKTAQGAKAATAALIGLLLIFSSYWLLEIVRIVTGINILNPGM